MARIWTSSCTEPHGGDLCMCALDEGEICLGQTNCRAYHIHYVLYTQVVMGSLIKGTYLCKGGDKGLGCGLVVPTT